MIFKYNNATLCTCKTCKNIIYYIMCN